MEHCSALRLSLCILLVLNMTQPIARAAADTLDPAVYAWAEALLGPNLVDKARNSFSTPHWLGDGELFWYRKELPNGHEDVVIDAPTGKPTTRFDAAELARQVQAVYASKTALTDVLMAPDGGSRSETGGGICISAQRALYGLQLFTHRFTDAPGDSTCGGRQPREAAHPDGGVGRECASGAGAAIR